MKKVFGYIRVSSIKQGSGVSLQEQKEAIERFAKKEELQIVRWFKELETAAKQGRPLFTEMIKLLKKRKAKGVIMHKIDRSARNLKDWSLVGELLDDNIEVHFAHESLDMNTRGGRLAADIQAVIASDYIRNLRQEALKGLYGRLKQGIYPFGAPVGYLNNGSGKLKTIDPIQGELVKKAFLLYKSSKYNLKSLVKTMRKLGLRNTNGGSVGRTSMSRILRNPFYMGIMKVQGRSFEGLHNTLISAKLFNSVQNVLDSKTNTKAVKHDFLFRRFLKCHNCNYSLIGEKQKGRVYYRCQTKDCITKTVFEGDVENILVKALRHVTFCTMETQMLEHLYKKEQQKSYQSLVQLDRTLKLQEAKLAKKIDRLTEAYLEEAIDLNLYEEKKQRMMMETKELEEKIKKISNFQSGRIIKLDIFLEQIKNLENSYSNGNKSTKRKIAESVTSNFAYSGRKPIFTMKSPYSEIANRSNDSSCGVGRTTPRTCSTHYATVAYSGDNYGDCNKVREYMKEILELIIMHFEPEEYDD